MYSGVSALQIEEEGKKSSVVYFCIVIITLLCAKLSK